MKSQKKGVNIILSLNIAFIIIILLTVVFPYISTDDGFLKFFSHTAFIYGTYEGLFLISISCFHLNKLRLKRSIIFEICGCVAILFNILLFTFVRPRYYLLDIGAYILIFILPGFTILIFGQYRVKNNVNFQQFLKKNEVVEYIKNLPSIYSQINLNQIMNKFHLKKRFMMDLKTLIEEMIYTNELNADIDRESIIFKKTVEKRPITDVLEPETDYKKRLFGMIRLRKEIDINEAAQFLEIEPRLIESLLYDLAGEKSIQGNFQGSKFIIESDIDEFINALDHSFNRWEDSQNRIKRE